MVFRLLFMMGGSALATMAAVFECLQPEPDPWQAATSSGFAVFCALFTITTAILKL